ncbi:hypothetical protein EPD60_10170 [Flaviaesturariibacter flavus]|uniref:Tetratricopeptide repeat protein n=1 Tax=Flaviaesturariibacter flavus TaxID=2502780 RepID=A0A4R1BBK0_9BACT|nr:hypothetical protein [Flaviaesturariibacter flavus]TCJ14354.1 hypothetical protein EPD60_10170 [Flaviaesturariibacter flavus]
MTWKIFTAFLAIAALALFPANGIGCAGGDEDGQDYFTSFFSRPAATEDPSLRPFFYTQLHLFYDYEDEDTSHVFDESLIAEWQRYCGGAARAEVEALVYETGAPALKQAAAANTLPAALQGNRAAANLAASGRKDAFRYLELARQLEAFSVAQEWDAPPLRDSAALLRIAATARASRQAAPDAFLKSKWAFLQCKADFYNQRWSDCVRDYDETFGKGVAGAVAPLARSYKAGSLYRLERKKEAAYQFSTLFNVLPARRRGIFTGFLWSTGFADSTLREEYAAQAKNDAERANLLGLFALYGTGPQEAVLERVYRLDPASPLLPLLASREISKAEEQYISIAWKWPKSLNSAFGYYYEADNEKKDAAEARRHLAPLSHTLGKIAGDKRIANRSFYMAGNAWLHLMLGNWAGGRDALQKAATLQPGQRVQDQLQLLQLLLASEEPDRIDAAREAALLPACRWLADKAKKDREYAVFCRNYFSEVLARRYRAQGALARTALCLGVSDLRFSDNPGNMYYNRGSGIEYVHYELPAASGAELYENLKQPATAFERFLRDHTSFNHNEVIESIGTGYLREEKYAEAVSWLQRADSLPAFVNGIWKGDETRTVNVAPFFDYLNDPQRYDSSLKRPMNKLSLAKALAALEQQRRTEKRPEQLARIYYRLASARYNMSYYGNCWMALAWDRTGSDWEYGAYSAPWQKEYFGVYRVEQLYQKAFDLTNNREFKAACLFLVAKCRQRQVARKGYDNPGIDYPTFGHDFYHSPFFPRLQKEFGDTKFFRYAYNRCSYLRDFVKKQSTTPSK